jgi:hypothetical protein
MCEPFFLGGGQQIAVFKNARSRIMKRRINTQNIHVWFDFLKK